MYNNKNFAQALAVRMLPWQRQTLLGWNYLLYKVICNQVTVILYATGKLWEGINELDTAQPYQTDAFNVVADRRRVINFNIVTIQIWASE